MAQSTSNYSSRRGNRFVNFHLPEEILAVIPTDCYNQLNLACKITSMEIASRVSKLEAETGRNSKGYEMVKRFTAKITHLSPVWYDLKSEGSKLVLEGRHNVDAGWISKLRMNGNILVGVSAFNADASLEVMDHPVLNLKW